MGPKMKGKAIIDAMAAIMFASVFAAMVGSAGAYSMGGEYNIIEMNPELQKVLIGQDLDFRQDWGPEIVTVSRVSGGVVEWSITADANNHLKVSEEEAQWTKDGAFFVNFLNPATYDAQLSVSEPIMPLELKVGTRKVSSIAVGTSLTLDTGGMNLFTEDRVDLVIIGPDGLIKYDEMNNQQFTNIPVDQLIGHYGYNNLETAGWSLGDYTFQVKTKSAYACGLEAASAIKEIKLEIGKIAIEAETTSTVELRTVILTVTGVAGDPIIVEASPLSPHLIFIAGIDDTPMTATNQFTDMIDADGIRRYAVAFNDTGTYTIKVTVTGGDRRGDSDTVDITVSGKAVEFDLPSIMVIGDRITIKGTANSGTYVSVYVDDVLYRKLVNLVIEDGEFGQEVKTTDVGLCVPGIVKLEAWIDCDARAGERIPCRNPDGTTTVLMVAPWLTARLLTDSVDQEGDFIVSGTAPGSTEVVILCVPPRGGGGKSLLDRGMNGLSPNMASVSTTTDEYTKKMTVQMDADSGFYYIIVLSVGMDGEWGMTGQVNLIDALNAQYGIDSLDYGIINTKTQD
jgi:PKD repeat protein